jgi:hypothetical protein
MDREKETRGDFGPDGPDRRAAHPKDRGAKVPKMKMESRTMFVAARMIVAGMSTRAPKAHQQRAVD